jgi:hypothetical protein
MTAERKTRALIAPLVTITPEERATILEAIRTRTVEEGNCLLWLGAKSSSAKSTKMLPAIWLYGKTKSLRRLAYVAYGKELFSHWMVSPECGNDLCVAEDCLKRVTRAETQTGTTRGIVTRTKIAAARQSRSPLDWEKVREIRASSLSNRKLAVLHNVDRDTIFKVRSHLTWRETGMFSSLVARS